MRKIILFLAGMVLVSTCAQAIDTVNFRGDILQACKLSMSSTPLTVDMGKYPASYFSQVGTKSPEKPFEIHISGCPNSNIALRWTGETVPNGDYALKVDGAKGLAIYIGDKNNGNKIANFKGVLLEDMYVITDRDGNYDFKLFAYYLSFETSVTPGSANASANVEVTYK